MGDLEEELDEVLSFSLSSHSGVPINICCGVACLIRLLSIGERFGRVGGASKGLLFPSGGVEAGLDRAVNSTLAIFLLSRQP